MNRIPSRARRSSTAVIALGSSVLLTLTMTPAAQGHPAVTSATHSTVPARAATEVHAPVPTIVWHDCHDGSGLKCTMIQVPLDYDQPNGAKISLRATMRPADNPAQRIGYLFVNPGGPGGSAADFTPYAAQLLGPAVRQRFNVIGVDPRGIAGSTPVVCRGNPGDPPLPPYPPVAFPRGPRQTAAWFAADEGIRGLCAEGGSAILDHMSTADTARDMDLIRQAVGDSQLTYYGISYGTMLGSTYAAMFPSRVRAIILDGVLDPVQWTAGRFDLGRRITVSARLRSGYGAWEALTSAFDECDRVGVHHCPQAGEVGTEWTKVITTLHEGAVRIGGQRVTYADIIGTLLGPLYDASDYPRIMKFIHQLYQQMFAPYPGVRAQTAQSWKVLRRAAADSGAIPPRYGGSSAQVPTAVNRYSPQFEGVICSDSVNPTDESAAIASAHFANRQGPWFGPEWAWVSAVCINWPGSSADAFQGPWRTKTANPVLITGNLHDPATPISGARAVNKLFAGSRMITVNLWGHGALGHSACVTKRWDAYLVSGELPHPGLVCQPDQPLFPR